MRVGKVTDNTLKRSVLKQIKTQFKDEVSAAVGTDCAFSQSGNTFSTVSTVTANISDAGYYAVIKAVNGLICQGIAPEQVLLNIMLPEDSDEPLLRQIVADGVAACALAKVPYTGGHTEVTTLVNRPLVTAVAVGCSSKENLINPHNKALAGDFLVISKCVGMEGTAMLAQEKFDELKSRYPAPFIEDAKALKRELFVQREIEIALKEGVHAVHDLSNGGVFAGLWEMAQKCKLGLKVDLKSIPMRQETVEICEFFEINPYQLLSGGAVLFATDNGEKLVERLSENGIPAHVVGELVQGNNKTIINADETRFLEMPQADEIHKILF